MTFDMNAAAAMVCETFTKRMAAIETAIAEGKTGFVFCWHDSGLAVSFAGGTPRATGIENATIVAHNDRRRVLNGRNEVAAVTPLQYALAQELTRVRATLANVQLAIAAKA